MTSNSSLMAQKFLGIPYNTLLESAYILLQGQNTSKSFVLTSLMELITSMTTTGKIMR